MASANTRAERLLTAADDAARLVRRVYITFLLLCVTVAAIIWSTTDEQLVRGSPLTLPQINIAPRIDAVYRVVPWVILIFHFNLLFLLKILAEKLRRLERAVAHPLTATEQEDFRVRPFPFPFSYMLIGRQRKWVMRLMLALVVWTTTILLPLFLLLWAQIRFLPFHDETITLSHRVAVAIDILLVWIIWPVLVGPDGRDWGWWPRIVRWPYDWALGLWALVQAGALLAASPWRGGHHGWQVLLPSVSALRLWLRSPGVVLPWRLGHRNPWRGRACGLLMLSVISVAGLWLSFGIAILPDELDRETEKRIQLLDAWAFEIGSRAGLVKESATGWCTVPPDLSDVEPWHLTYCLFDAADAPFHRNLRLKGKTLVAGKPPAELLVKLRSEKEGERREARQKVLGFNLANRDLRSADFGNAILVRANLQGANLDGANFIQADLTGADLGPFDITDGGECVGEKDQGHELTEVEQVDVGIRPIRKPKGIFCLTDLRNVKLGETKLAMARLPMAQLQGLDFSKWDFQGANLSGARLQGAVLEEAQLQGANLANAQLQGANLIRARLGGADLSHAQLQGANLGETNLRGADLFGADLRGADLSNADLRGANLTAAEVGGARFDSVDLSFSDLREVDRKPLTEKDYEELKNALEKVVDDEEKLNFVLESLVGTIDRLDNMKDAKAAKNVLCDFGPLLPGRPCPSKLSVEQYDKGLVDEVLGPLGCDDTYIARGMARRAITSAPSKRDLGPLLAEALLDPKCVGGMKLPEETRAELKRIMRRR